MKKLAIYILLTLISASVNLCISQTETNLQDIKDEVSAYTNRLDQDKSYEVVNTTFNVITNNDTKSFTKNLDPSYDYIIAVIGDNSIDRLTLDINNGTTTELNYNSETTTANAPVRIIKSGGNSTYEFTVRNAKYYGGNSTGNFAIIIYRKNS